MASRTENIKLNVYLNDQQAGNTMAGLNKQSRILRAQLNKLEIGSDEWIKKMKELQYVNKQTSRLRKEMRGMNSILYKFKNMAGGLLPAFSFAAIITGLGRFGKELLGLKTEMQATVNKASIVLGDSFGYVEEKAKELGSRVGLTRMEFIKATANTADLLVPLGFARDRSAKMATELTKLSGALSEWTGGQFTAIEVSEDLTKGMLGEMEVLKKYGIAIRKDSPEFKALVKLKMQDKEVTLAQAEAMTTLELIMNKTKDAQTSFASEGNKLLRFQKDISTLWRTMKERLIGYDTIQKSHIDKLQEEQTELNILITRITDANIAQDERRKLISQLQTNYPDFLGSLNAETVSNEQLALRMADVNKQYVNKIILASQEEKIQKQANVFASRRTELATKEVLINNMVTKANLDYELGLDLTNKTLQEKFKITRQALREMGAATDSNNKAFVVYTKLYKQMILYNNIQSVVNDEQKKLNDIMKEGDDIIKAAGLTWDMYNQKVSGAEEGGTGGQAERQKENIDKISTYRINSVIDTNEQILDEDKLYVNRRIQLEYDKAKKLRYINHETIAGSLSIASGVLGNLAGLYEHGSESFKKLAAMQARIDAVAAAVSAYRFAIPIVGPFFAAIPAAAALAFGLKKASEIEKMEIPQYALGGAAKGGPHLGWFNEEGPEYIIPHWLRQDPRVANMENIIEGMRVRGYAEGGSTTINNVTNNNAVATDPNTMALTQAILRLNKKLEEGITAQGVWEWDKFKKGYNDMTDIEDGGMIN